jgi:phage shock protein A
LEAQQAKLVEGEKTLSAKVESFRTEKEVIKAQYSAAEAQVKISEAATGIGENMTDVGQAVQRAKDKTEQMQARAAAVEELSAAGTLQDFTSSGDDIDRQLREIQASGQVDDELAKMKAELGGGTADEAKELPSADNGAPPDTPAADAAPAPETGGDTAQSAG